MAASFHNLKLKKSSVLTRPTEELKRDFLVLRSSDELATLLDVSLQQLMFHARVKPQAAQYREYTIQKRSGGLRTIAAPITPLKLIQRKLAQVLAAVYVLKAPVHGFVEGRSIVSNARQHRRRKWVLNVDLVDFFNTITFKRIVGLLMAIPYGLPRPVAVLIAQLTTFKGSLPQGSPCSPILSNMLCARLDSNLRILAKEVGIVYTRYADDLSFSSNRKSVPEAICTIVGDPYQVQLGARLVGVISSNGFAIKPEKTRLQLAKRSQRVTGLVVNRSPNVPRWKIRNVRAMLHNLRMLGPEKCQAEFENRSKISPGVTTKPGKKPPQFLNKLRGEIAYIGMVRGKDDVLYQKLKFNLESILHPTREIMRPLVSSNDEKRDVFICHASEDKTLIVEPLVAALSRRGVSVWYDRTHIGWGDSISGSINEGLRTSRYVLVVLSTAFIVKEWARRELNAAIGAEIRHGETSVLPLVVGDAAQQKQVLDAFPFHADKLHRIWLGDAELIADELVGLVRTR